jgi:hypothetical protein
MITETMKEFMAQGTLIVGFVSLVGGLFLKANKSMIKAVVREELVTVREELAAVKTEITEIKTDMVIVIRHVEELEPNGGSRMRDDITAMRKVIAPKPEL